MSLPFLSEVQPPSGLDGPAWWFAFRQDRLLVQADEALATVPCLQDLGQLGLHPLRQQYLGRLDGRLCYSAELPEEAAAPEGMAFLGLRQLFDRLPAELFQIAMGAVKIVAWDRDNQFCGRCGEKMEHSATERSKVCPRCGLTRYPRISPAIIVAVEREGKLLLARNHRFPPGWFSVLAGFVEPGETLEMAVEREVREEVGIEVTDITYFGSQPWPFPDSLMLAFTARYAGGELAPEETEIAEAGWFRPEEMPAKIPGPMSISRRLIDAFLATHA